MSVSSPSAGSLTIRYTDTLIHSPGDVDVELRRALLEHFSPSEIVELTATITAAIAFSKAAVAFGAPAEMPVMEVATPSPND